MYFVNREKIEEVLTYMESLLNEMSEHTFTSFADQLLLERMTHMMIEAILDTGNMMIDGFIMRDPGSYEDIIDILTDEQVLPENAQDGYKAIIKLRKDLVQNYTHVNHDEVIRVWKENKKELGRFPNRVRTYLDQELGPVSAFSKQ